MKTDLFVPSAAADRLASASGAHAGTDGTSDGSGPSGGGGGSNHVAVPSYVPVLFVVTSPGGHRKADLREIFEMQKVRDEEICSKLVEENYRKACTFGGGW